MSSSDNLKHPELQKVCLQRKTEYFIKLINYTVKLTKGQKVTAWIRNKVI